MANKTLTVELTEEQVRALRLALAYAQIKGDDSVGVFEVMWRRYQGDWKTDYQNALNDAATLAEVIEKLAQAGLWAGEQQ